MPKKSSSASIERIVAKENNGHTIAKGMEQVYASLIARREDLRERLAKHLRELQEDGNDHEITGSMSQLESQELQKVERAIAKLQSGSKGQCERCMKKISPARLKAAPSTENCVECQRQIDNGILPPTVEGESWARIEEEVKDVPSEPIRIE